MRTLDDKGCERVARILTTSPGLRLDDPEEDELRGHLAACDACRGRAVEADPALLFLDLRSRQLPPAFWTGFDAGLRERLAERPRLGWRALLLYPRLAYVTAPLAMLLVLGVTLFVARPRLMDPGGRGGPDLFRSPFDQVAIPGRPAPPGPARSALPGGAPLSSPAQAGSAGPPILEEVVSPGARVYHFTVEGSGSETPIYLVVDESIDI